MVKSLAPFVYWAQTESEVLMRVDLKNVEEPTITLGNITATYKMLNFFFCRSTLFVADQSVWILDHGLAESEYTFKFMIKTGTMYKILFLILKVAEDYTVC
jgi:hypothetical protein